MKKETSIIVLLTFLASVSGVFAATAFQQRKTKKVTRVKRPQFTPQDSDGIYFDNLFTEGLVGDRPKSALPGQQPKPGNGQEPSTVPGNSSSEYVWSQFISGPTLEDEIKTLQNRLMRDVTTPGKFKTDYAKAHQSFSGLSMLFGIIREYDDEVRWKEFSGAAQASFEKAASNSRVGSVQAYESCKRRRDDLQELVRGGKFSGTDKPPETLDWGNVVGRSPMMERLQEAQDSIKELTANQSGFEREIPKIFHESQIVAAMAHTLMKENMQDADDDEYNRHAIAMRDAAVSLAQACQARDYESASRAVNLVGQSCSNCHDQWR